MKLVAKNKNGFRILLLCIITLLIRWIYMYITQDILYPLSYGDAHPHYDLNYNLDKDIISGLFFLIEIVLLFSLCRESKFKDNLLHLLFILYLMPLNAISPLVNAGYDFLLLSNWFILEIIICLSIHSRRSRCQISINANEDVILTDKRIRIVCFVICILFITFKISINGFQFSLQLLGEETYANRVETTELIREICSINPIINIVLGVINNFATYIAPIYLFVSLKEKKVIEIIVAFLTILSQFSLYSMKTTLFLIPIVLIIAFYEGKPGFRELIYGGCIIAFIILLIVWKGFGLMQIYYVIVRRTMYMPTWLNTMYYDFFSKHTPVFLTDEVFLVKHLFPHVYNEGVLTLIGDNYFEGLVVSPNNGMFAEGYMQFGIPGVLLYPIIYRWVFDWIEKVYKNFGEQFNLLICSIIAINLPNVGMFRTDFVMSFILMTFVLQCVWKYKIKIRG